MKLKMKVNMCNGKKKFYEKYNKWSQNKIEISLPQALQIEEYLLENTQNWLIQAVYCTLANNGKSYLAFLIRTRSSVKAPVISS